MKELLNKVWEMESEQFAAAINSALLHFGMAVIVIFVIVLIFFKCRAQQQVQRVPRWNGWLETIIRQLSHHRP